MISFVSLNVKLIFNHLPMIMTSIEFQKGSFGLIRSSYDDVVIF